MCNNFLTDEDRAIQKLIYAFLNMCESPTKCHYIQTDSFRVVGYKMLYTFDAHFYGYIFDIRFLKQLRNLKF